MKKIPLFLFLIISLSLLAACGSTEDVTEYVDVSFSGMDSEGSASQEVDEAGLINELFDLEEGRQDYPDSETAEEAMTILSAYELDIEPNENLSNGDKVKVTISVDEDKTDKIEGGDKEFTVEGLEEPEVLTTEDVETNLVFNFNGVSGRGVAQIDTVFDEGFLNNLQFAVENDGELANGDEAEITIDQDDEEIMHDNGYVLDDEFHPTVEVKDLEKVAEKASDIKNLDDIERFIDEELNGKYEDTERSFVSDVEYKIEQEKLMYRQFNKASDDEMNSNNVMKDNGNLIGIFSIEEYKVDSDDEKELDDEFTVVMGFSGIILDENDQANLSELEKIHERKEDNYSVESIIQLYEGEGYEEVK